jgi:hypothetical protein
VTHSKLPPEDYILERVKQALGPVASEAEGWSQAEIDAGVLGFKAGHEYAWEPAGGGRRGPRQPGEAKAKVRVQRDPTRLSIYERERAVYGTTGSYAGPYRARVGYGKIGRVTELEPDVWDGAGDNEPPCFLNKLALAHPDVEFVVLGRNDGVNPQDLGFPGNVTNPWQEWKPSVTEQIKGHAEDRQWCQNLYDEVTQDTFKAMNGHVFWVGQHGTSNSRIPQTDGSGKLTEPQISFIHYASFIVRGINAWRDQDPLNNEEIWICPDPRNYIKARDLKWPLRNPVLSQYNWVRPDKLERYGDTRQPHELGFPSAFEHNHGVWQAPYIYEYAGVEVTGIPSGIEVTTDFGERAHFGIIINEARAYVKHDRLTAMLDYVKPLDPAWVHGKWLATSEEKLGMGSIEPIHYSTVIDKVRTVKSTFTTPSSGSGWATTKPWEAFAVGTVCFVHPEYDTQGHIIPTLTQVEEGQVQDEELKALAQWLRVKDPADLEKRVKAIDTSRETFEWLSGAQRRHFDRMMAKRMTMSKIEQRLGLSAVTTTGDNA